MSFDTTASKEFVKVAELATQWRCTEQHIYNLINRGLLPATNIGRRVIVCAKDAERFIERNSTAKLAA